MVESTQSTYSKPPEEPSFGHASLRILWLLLTAVLLVIFIAGLQPRFEELRQACEHAECPILTLNSAEAAVLTGAGWSLSAYAAFHVILEIAVGGVFTLLAFLLFWKGFGERMGKISAFALVLFGLNFMVEADSSLVGILPWIELPLQILTMVATLPFLGLFFLFPNGRFVPRASVFLFWPVAILAVIDPLLQKLGFTTPSGQLSQIFMVIFLVCLLLGAVAQIFRYQTVSTSIERQQTKWVVLGLVLLVGPIVFWSLFVELFPPEASRIQLLFHTVLLAAMMPFIFVFPLSLVFSILRYRLWDIDLIIRRTLVYGLASALLGSIYLGAVVVLQRLFEAVTGQQSPLSIVISTLLIAALFNPIRRRLQDFIDRRFYRTRFNAARTLAAFARTARDETDMHRLSAGLRRAIQETLRPAGVHIWFRDADASDRSVGG